MKVSVIIPIFRVEDYIRRCVYSLMEQSLDDVEYIFVDDCTPDRSMEILEQVLSDYPQRKEQIKILRNTVNRGLPAARNTGLTAASGEYIFHCDSDDYLEHDALQVMYEAAVKTNADIVYTDWFLTNSNKERYMKCPNYVTAEMALQGLLHGTMKYNVWNKLVRRSLYKTINQSSNLGEGEVRGCFPEGHSMGEDMTMILLYAQAKKIVYLPKGTYHYMRQNENAFTANRSESSYNDLIFNANRVIDALKGRISEIDLACFKLNVKFPFLISCRREDYGRWKQWFPEANKYIHLHQVSFRARILERCASFHFFLPIRIHYYLLLHFQG